MAVTAQDDLYTLTADNSALWRRSGSRWEQISGPAGSVYAGRAGVFITRPGTNTQISKYNDETRAWEPIVEANGSFAVTGDHLYHLTPDGVGQWDGEEWTKIGGPAKNIYAGRAGLFATNPDTGDLYQYNDKPDKWTRIGGPGAQFAVGHDHVYRLSPDHTAVYEWTGKGTDWTRIGGPAQNLYAGGAGLFATNRDTGNIHQYNNTPDAWTEIGGRGATFAVSDTQLYGLSPDLTTAYRWNGTGQEWTRIGGAADVAQQHQDEQLLSERCGQECVEKYREAKKILETSVTDWLKEKGADILLDLFSVDDIIKCAHKDAASCFEVVIDAGSTVLSIGAYRKAAKSTKAVATVAKDLPKFLEKAKQARDTYDRLRKILDTVQRNQPDKPDDPQQKPCPVNRPANTATATAYTTTSDLHHGTELTSARYTRPAFATDVSDFPDQTDCEDDPTWGGRVVFTRDEYNRPHEMKAIITSDMLNKGTKANNSLRPPGFLGGNENQARGHLLAAMLGGSGNTLDNLFTITQDPTNTPKMRAYEQIIFDAVKGGDIVIYSVFLEYSDDLADSVPQWIQLEAKTVHGYIVEDQFFNPAHDQQQQLRGHP
ncbi:hypothetical protein G3I60_36905 [Streptomyces sp. SID13666]|nr:MULTISPECIES: DNA/RNA non-specific endonuclease [unclassified Streptomyces]NEA59592.1 hypothetical protein [Streptomyces sp. SID13666]NEA75790.1 hypothetical protein [Streptomyces sp. SID13588]